MYNRSTNIMDQRKSDYNVGSVGKALQILCTFSTAVPQLSVSQIGRKLGLPKSTTHNLLHTLASFDFVRQDEETRLFRLGPRLYELGLQVSQLVKIESVGRPHLRHLKELTKETVKLAVPSDGEVLVIAAEESPYELHTRGDAGRRTPLHSTSLGKAILASLPDEEIRSLLERRGLHRFTTNTITDLARLQREIATVRSEGYALDWEESELGVRCAAAAVTDVTGRVVATISISGPTTRISRQRIRELASYVKEHAVEISKALARRGPR